MKKVIAIIALGAATLGLVAGTGVATASPPPPAGYVTKTVRDAGLKVAVPETFVDIRQTRKQLKAFLDANPDAREAGTTVDALRKTFSAGGDFDGDGKKDFTIEVQTGLAATFSPTQAREQLTALGYREVSASKTKVAGRRAVVTDYVGARTLSDGTTLDLHATVYVFESPSAHAAVHIAFARRAGDKQYEDMIDTMINSVRFVKP